MSFFDTEDILTTNERIFCNVNEQFREAIGSVLGTTLSRNTNANHVELPFWLAAGLANSEIVTFEDFPGCFQSVERIQANPLVVSLHDCCPNFYKFGVAILLLLETDGALKRILANTLLERIKMIFSWSMSSKSRIANPNSVHDFIALLDETERGLYKLGISSKLVMDKWAHRKCDRIRAIRSGIL